jgi:hypothetical protein
VTKIKPVIKSTIKPIPPFKTMDEEAEFWDTHSVVDKIDDGTLVGFHQANKSDTITVRFQPEHLRILREEAFERGIGPTTLVRMWTLERIKGRFPLVPGK